MCDRQPQGTLFSRYNKLLRYLFASGNNCQLDLYHASLRASRIFSSSEDENMRLAPKLRSHSIILKQSPTVTELITRFSEMGYWTITSWAVQYFNPLVTIFKTETTNGKTGEFIIESHKVAIYIGHYLTRPLLEHLCPYSLSQINVTTMAHNQAECPIPQTILLL